MTNPRPLLAGPGVVVLWAGAFPAVRVAVPQFGVTALSFARRFVATVVLLALVPLFEVELPRWRDIPLILCCGFFGMAAYQLLLNRGEVDVPAGMASMIIAAALLDSANRVPVRPAQR